MAILEDDLETYMVAAAEDATDFAREVLHSVRRGEVRNVRDTLNVAISSLQRAMDALGPDERSDR